MILTHHEDKYDKKHTQETFEKGRTIVNMISKRTEDFGFKHLKTLRFIYVSNVISYHASPAELFPPRILHPHAI